MNDSIDRGSPRGPVSKILFLLTRKEKIRLAFLLGGLLVNGLIDVLGASSILPFIAVVAKPSMVETNVHLKQAYVWSGAGRRPWFRMISASCGPRSLTIRSRSSRSTAGPS